MYRFLIQSEIAKNNNRIPMQDFGYEVIKSIEYYDWIDSKKRYDYELVTDFAFKSSKYRAPETVPFNFLTSESIPVGSVEFVSEFIKQCYRIKNITPINIPQELLTFANRDIRFIKNSDFYKLLDLNKEYFIKSATKIKGYTDRIVPKDTTVPDDIYMVSDIIDIDTEWRCFIKDGKLLDIRCYSGNPFIMPSIPVIENMIKSYKSCPPAYTLDVCIESNGQTSIIECHNFFSCGLYGFSDYKNYPIMLIRAFKWQVNAEQQKRM